MEEVLADLAAVLLGDDLRQRWVENRVRRRGRSRRIGNKPTDVDSLRSAHHGRDGVGRSG